MTARNVDRCDPRTALVVRVLRTIYTCMYACLVPLLLLRLFARGRVQPGYRVGWRQRLGYYTLPACSRPPVWIHAVSVGESMAAVPLVRALQEHLPEYDILVTTTTATGAQTVRRMFGERVTLTYFPYDLPAVARRFLAHFRPRMAIFMETELWPNILAACTWHGIPLVLANARLSARSLRGYRCVMPLCREMLGRFNLLAAQSKVDAERLLTLGANPAAVRLFGNLKFDVVLPPSVLEEGAATRRELGINRPLFIAASTRDGEEVLVLDAFARLREKFPSAMLILAPRHPDRFDEVHELLRGRGLSSIRRSAGTRCDDATAVYLVDSMGELPRFYAAADVAFVGGSLLPFGGHNVLEPAAVGTPVVVGPHTGNFAEITQLLAANQALVVVDDSDGLRACVLDWLSDSNERDRVGRNGRAAVLRHRGATERTVEALRAVLSACANSPSSAAPRRSL